MVEVEVDIGGWTSGFKGWFCASDGRLWVFQLGLEGVGVWTRRSSVVCFYFCMEGVLKRVDGLVRPRYGVNISALHFRGLGLQQLVGHLKYTILASF